MSDPSSRSADYWLAALAKPEEETTEEHLFTARMRSAAAT